MQIHKLTSTNAFVVLDLDDVAHAAGILRVAPKVLQGSTQALARTATYTFAARGLQIGGASGGISADAAGRDDAVAAFVAEVTPQVASGQLTLDPGPGIDADDLAALDAVDTRSALRSVPVDGLPLARHLDALGAVVAADAALDGLDGRTAVVEAGPNSARLVRELAARGARVVGFGGPAGVAYDPAGLDTDALVEGDTETIGSLGLELRPAASLTTLDAAVLFCGSRQGMIDGDVASLLGAGLVVPTGCQPVSAKGLAVLQRLGIIVLPDFVTTSGSTYAGWPDPTDSTADDVVATAAAAIQTLVADTIEHPEGPLLGACYQAEAFLSTWQETLPFGRPIA